MYYATNTSILRVRFNNGDCFEYDQVPPAVVDQLKQAKSLGTAFHALVRNGGYQFRPVGK
jgi:hypothetical protein